MRREEAIAKATAALGRVHSDKEGFGHFRHNAISLIDALMALGVLHFYEPSVETLGGRLNAGANANYGTYANYATSTEPGRAMADTERRVPRTPPPTDVIAATHLKGPLHAAVIGYYIAPADADRLIAALRDAGYEICRPGTTPAAPSARR